MFHPLLLFGLEAFFFSHAARSQNVAWVNPPIAGLNSVYSADKVWQVGSTQTLSWELSYQTADVYLYQQNLVGADRHTTVVMDLVGTTQFEWVVNTGSINLTSPGTVPGVYYLAVNASDNSGDSLIETSHYINITAAATTSSSTSVSSAAATSSFSTSVSSTAATSSTPQSGTETSAGGGNHTSLAPSGTSTKKGGALSTGAIAGIAVACALVCVSFLAGLVFLYYQNKKIRRQLAQATAPNQHGGPIQLSGWRSELPAIGERGELGPGNQMAELGAGYGVRHEIDGRHRVDRTS